MKDSQFQEVAKVMSELLEIGKTKNIDPVVQSKMQAFIDASSAFTESDVKVMMEVEL